MPLRREFQQGSAAWLAWRRGGIGASYAPTIMGVSPWMDLDTLWLDKTGRRRDGFSNHAMRRGQRLEPEARDLLRERFDQPVRVDEVRHLVRLALEKRGLKAQVSALRRQIEPERWERRFSFADLEADIDLREIKLAVEESHKVRRAYFRDASEPLMVLEDFAAAKYGSYISAFEIIGMDYFMATAKNGDIIEIIFTYRRIITEVFFF